MDKYFKWGYDLDPFVLFSIEHILTIVLVVLLCAGVVFSRKSLRKENLRNPLRYGLAAILICSELSYHTWQIYYGEWNISYSLPLHLSSVSLIFSVIMLLTKNEKVFAFVFFAGIGSALQAMVTPVIDGYSFPHFRYIHFYVAHGGVVIACTYMIAVEKYRPTIKSLWRSFLYLNVYTLFIFFVNLLVDGNYMFVMQKPPTASILDILGPWPWYILPLEIITLISFFILWVPFRLVKNDE
jgi:hypothetical integral membrane protein (TIGR02206 family)